MSWDQDENGSEGRKNAADTVSRQEEGWEMTPGFGDTAIAGVSGNTDLGGVLGPNPAWSGRKRDRKERNKGSVPR